jgi:hypothetical protein
MKHATISTTTTVILHTGRGGTLPPGSYEVAELDGTEGQLFLFGPNGDLVQADPHDSRITIEEN